MGGNKDGATGIKLVAERLNTGGLTVDPTCRHTIDEYFDYRWAGETDSTTKVRYAGERPVKHHADLMDAVRYAVMALSQSAGMELPELKKVGNRLVHA